MIHDVKKIVIDNESHKLDSGSCCIKIAIETKNGWMDIDLFSTDKDNLKLIYSD